MFNLNSKYALHKISVFKNQIIMNLFGKKSIQVPLQHLTGKKISQIKLSTIYLQFWLVYFLYYTKIYVLLKLLVKCNEPSEINTYLL